MASAGTGEKNLNASQFYITLRDDLDTLDGEHTVFGEITEGFDRLNRINEACVDDKGKPYQNIRIKHTYISYDPFDDMESCEQAYFKTDNTLIDDRRIRIDFSQSVANLWPQYRPTNQRGSDRFNNGSVDAIKQQKKENKQRW
ncbi:hypothetical protein RDI58_004791 [Solanum bulbocastanum]|uniref:PPIase cyclophilin-type domain-containing protein n=1 Tax=Solanum bulbocastanum TaxID=147425 RepID=A0AAN8TZP7_SOLBU